MSSENSNTSEAHRLLLNLTDKINLNRDDIYIGLSNFSIYYTLKSRKTLHKINKFKISCLTWNEKFDLLDGSYSVSDIQD